MFGLLTSQWYGNGEVGDEFSYRLNASLDEHTNGSGLKDSSGGSDRINDGCGEGGSGDGDGFRSKRK